MRFIEAALGSFLAFAILAALFVAPAQAGANPSIEETNKAIVVDFYTKLFVQKDFDAARGYFGDRYIQHNPNAPDGPEALRGFLLSHWKTYPNARSEIRHVYADGDIVILHVNAIPEPGESGFAIVDIFRLETGKIVEHWDVVQKIPPTSANSNTMF